MSTAAAILPFLRFPRFFEGLPPPGGGVLGHSLYLVVTWAQPSQHRGDHAVFSVGRAVQVQGAFPAWWPATSSSPWSIPLAG